MSVPARTAEVAVVGAGVVGLAAADALLAAGADVRVFERGEPGSGQSAGYTRVFRHVHDRVDLVSLALEAREAWDVWSERAGRPLVGSEGVLYAAPDAGAVARLFERAGVEHRWLDAEEQRRLLAIAEPAVERALLDVRGGAIRVRPTIEALTAFLGNRVVQEEVLAVRPDGAGALLATPEGMWRADRVLVCAGVGTAALAEPLGVRLPLDLRLHVRVSFRVRDELADRPPACLLDRSGAHGATVYASPVEELGAFAVGLGTEDAEVGGDVDESVARVHGYVERGLPGLDSRPQELRPCWLTLLPWHADAFAVWKADTVLVFAGSNLFKFAPTLGRLLAEAALSGRVPSALRPRS